MSEPFTLRVFVPSGDPEGTRIVEKMNWTGRGYYVPRDDWENIRNRGELAGPGVYVLLGYEQDEIGNEVPVAYIGQTDSLRLRIDQHDKGKDFWENAMFFLSTNGGLNRAHITWLEWELMAQAVKAKRGRLENGLSHSEPTLSESEKADVRSFLNEMLRLMPVMGVHFFEPAKSIPVAPAASPIAKSVAVPEVVVVPAQPEGFQNAYLDQNAWWAIRIAAKHRDNLKWIAAYQVNPIGAVTHIAEIDHIEPFGDEGKFKLYFKGPATKLAKPIPYGNAPSGAMQGPRYCTKEAFDNAGSVADLVVSQ
ncbi:hypothetical protein GCM10023208_23600 [Erythrobacter westpacificensis]|uniref:GIY-YIG nuclease family protein n=1 Tax=Erythrobacter westpacificensis TaxID=1055231 RepID=A0ABP9KG76_9SPHN